MDIRQQAVSGLKWTGLSSVVSTIIQLARTVVLARLLAPQDFGLMGMVMVVLGFAQNYTDLGLGAAIIHRQDVTRDQLSSQYWLNVLTGFILFGLIWAFTPLVVHLFRESRLTHLLEATALVFIIAPFGTQFHILLQKELHFNILVKQEIVAGICGLFVAIGCAVSGFGVWSLILGTITEVTCKTLLAIRIGLARYRPSFHFRGSDVRSFMSFGLYQTGERTVNYLSERLDQILVGSLLGAEALGFYNFAFNLVTQPISRINPIITRIAFPVFSKVQHDTEKLRSGYIKMINNLTTINAPLLIGMASVAPLAVPLIFGPKWSKSIILIQLLSFVALCRSSGNPIGSLQLAKGRADLGFKWNVALLAVSAPAMYIGGLVGKGVGVATSLLILQIISYMPAYVYLVRPLIGECIGKYTTALLKPIGIAIIMGLIILPIPYILKVLPDPMALIVQIGFGILLYMSLLWLMDKNVVYEFKDILASRSTQVR